MINQDSKHQSSKVIEACNDCDVIISQQFGFKSKIHAEDNGIKLVTGQGSVSEALNEYINHYEFMKK